MYQLRHLNLSYLSVVSVIEMLPLFLNLKKFFLASDRYRNCKHNHVPFELKISYNNSKLRIIISFSVILSYTYHKKTEKENHLLRKQNLNS